MLKTGISLLFAVAGASALSVPKSLSPFKEFKAEKCPEGFTRIGHKCSELEPIGSLGVCPKGALENDGGCFFADAPHFMCAEGVPLKDRTCEVVVSAPSEIVCPEGTTQDGDKCFIGTNLTVCPVGTARTPKGQCGKLFEKGFVCPSGTKPSGDLCSSTEDAAAELICPEGTTLYGHKCVADAERAPICPSGAADEGETCAFFYPPTYDCTEGFSARDGACVVDTHAELIVECPAGGDLVDHTCRKAEQIPETVVCQNGILVEGQCVITMDFPVSYQCPTGYALEDGKAGLKCISTVTYDCSVTKYECDPDRAYDVQVHAQKKDPTELIHQNLPQIPSHLRHLAEKMDPKDLLAGYHPSVHELHDYCYKVSVVVPKTCEKSTEADPIPFCSEGNFNGYHKCEVRIHEEPTLQCEATVNVDGICVLEETYAAVYTCPEGYANKHKQCVQTIYGQIIFVCPEGTHEWEGQCATFVPKECPKGGCGLQVSTKPEVACPVGFVLGYDLHGKDVCIKTVYVFQEPADCPPGTAEVSPTTCGKLVAPVSVDDKAYVAPQILCPVGFFAKHLECWSISYKIADPTCPPDFHIVDDSVCVRPVEPVAACPRGAVIKDGICNVEVKVNPMVVTSPVMRSPMELPPIPSMPKLPVPALPVVTIPKPTIDIPKPTINIPKPTVDIQKPQVSIPKPTIALPAKPTLPKATAFIPASMAKYVPFLGGR